MPYRMAGVDPDPHHVDWDVITGTHAALPDTFIAYCFSDGTIHKTPVILWGVQQDGSPVPITLDGVWDGVESGGGGQANACVVFPSGHCGRFERTWETLEKAAAEIAQYDKS
jgi:hypothetical protein